MMLYLATGSFLESMTFYQDLGGGGTSSLHREQSGMLQTREEEATISMLVAAGSIAHVKILRATCSAFP